MGLRAFALSNVVLQSSERGPSRLNRPMPRGKVIINKAFLGCALEVCRALDFKHIIC